MHSLLFSLFLLFSLVLTEPSDLVARQHTKKCPKGVHIIAIRGDGNGPPPGYGLIIALVNAIKAEIPHSTNNSVPYPKTKKGLDGANQAGVKHMTEMIEDFVDSCPKGKLVIVGYSEGAPITMNTICGTSNAFLTKTKPLPKKYTKNVIAVAVYSDATRVSTEPYIMGTCKGPSKFPRPNPRGCDPYLPVIQSYCDKPDNFCCAGGNKKKFHYQYFPEYDKKVAKFAAKQFKKSQQS